MINATAVHALEFDDIGPGGHNGSVTLSAVLAMAQHTGKLSSVELINAIVMGIETTARVGLSVGVQRTSRCFVTSLGIWHCAALGVLCC